MTWKMQDLVGAIGRIFGEAPTMNFNGAAGDPVPFECNLQAFGKHPLRARTRIFTANIHSFYVNIQ